MHNILTRFIGILEACVSALRALLAESSGLDQPDVSTDEEDGALPDSPIESPHAEEERIEARDTAAKIAEQEANKEKDDRTEAVIEVGMWYCEPRYGISSFDADIYRMLHGGVNCMQSWDAGQIWAKWQGINTSDWAAQQGAGWAGYAKRLASVNKQPKPEQMRTILFKPIWGSVASGKRHVKDIEQMCRQFVSQLEKLNGDEDVLGRIVRGVCLGDDFAKHAQSGLYSDVVSAIGQELGPTRFYMSNQMFDPILYQGAAGEGSKMNALRRWIRPMAAANHTFVYLPQYYPWVGMDYLDSKSPKWYEWLRIGLDECVAQKRYYPNTLEIMPILQASAWSHNRGPTHEEQHKQIRTSLAAGCNGIWFIGWHNPSYPSLKCYWDARSNFGNNRRYDEAIGTELAGNPCSIEHG